MGMTTLTLPRLGETMEEARVTDWLKAPGEAFRRGDVLMEVETDKTVVEVPALSDGRLLAHLVAPGDRVALDQPFAQVEVTGALAGPAPEGAGPVPAAAATPASLPSQTTAAPMAPAPAAPYRPAASPRARRLARLTGISLAGLGGTGRRGRITGDDVAGLAGAPRQGPAPRPGPVALRVVPGIGAERVPVLLLHGLYDEGRGWRDLPDRLAQAGHPVWVADLPGHGASAPAASVDEAVDRIAAALPDGRLRLVGHSMGAVLAALLADRLGDRAEGLVLIAPAGLGPRISADFLDGMATAETPAALARALALLGGGPLSPLMLEAELARLRAIRPGLGPLVGALAREGMQQTDIAPLLDRMTLPVRAVFGLQDRIIGWQDCASLPPRAAIHLLRGAGHLPHLADPQAVSALITAGDAERAP